MGSLVSGLFGGKPKVKDNSEEIKRAEEERKKADQEKLALQKETLSKRKAQRLRLSGRLSLFGERDDEKSKLLGVGI
jgi:hypothetical protein